MLKSERHARLLERPATDGRIEAGSAAADLAVSEDTVRRDLRELAAAGKLRRACGGAVPRALPPLPYARRHGHDRASKSAIAEHAAQWVGDGQLIFIDGGPTALRLARSLARSLARAPDARVVTAAPAAACARLDHDAVTVHLTGGQLHRGLDVCVGAEASEFLGRFRADIAFLGVCTLDAQAGLTIPEPAELANKRRMVQQAARVIALAGADKLGSGFAYLGGRCGVGHRPGTRRRRPIRGHRRAARPRGSCSSRARRRPRDVGRTTHRAGRA